VIRQLCATVVWEELKQREDKNEPALERGAETEEFIKNCLIENDVPLKTQLGMHDGPPLRFLTGVFIATLTLKQQVQFLQEVVQADGAHMPFGKYTLFSVYANSAPMGQWLRWDFPFCSGMKTLQTESSFGSSTSPFIRL
jgi:hypothetical protein